MRSGERLVAAQAHQLERGDDRRQRVAQLVAEHGEELVLRAVGHLGLGPRLALAHQQLAVLLLHPLAVGDVREGVDRRHDPPLRVEDRRGADREDPPHAVRVVVEDLLVEDRLAGERPGQRVLVRRVRPAVGMDRPVGGEVLDRAGGSASWPRIELTRSLASSVRPEGASAMQHPGRDLVDHRLEQPAGLLDLAPRRDLGGDVDGHRHQAGPRRSGSRIGWVVNLKKTSSTSPSPEVERHAVLLGAERLAARLDPLQHGEDRRVGRQLGERFADRLADEVRTADHPVVERIGEVVDQLGTGATQTGTGACMNCE